MQRSSIVFLTGALALSLGPPLHAQDVSLKFDPSLLATQAGLRDVYNQMARAAFRACVDTGVAGRDPENVRKCRANVLKDLVHNSNVPALVALHAGNRGRALAAEKFGNADGG